MATALDDLRAVPDEAKRRAGYQLRRLQDGLQPDDWKPMTTVGSGVNEIRIRLDSGAYRILYVAKFADAIYVLHCFQKKAQQTSTGEITVARRRYQELLKEPAG